MTRARRLRCEKAPVLRGGLPLAVRGERMENPRPKRKRAAASGPGEGLHEDAASSTDSLSGPGQIKARIEAQRGREPTGFMRVTPRATVDTKQIQAEADVRPMLHALRFPRSRQCASKRACQQGRCCIKFSSFQTRGVVSSCSCKQCECVRAAHWSHKPRRQRLRGLRLVDVHRAARWHYKPRMPS